MNGKIKRLNRMTLGEAVIMVILALLALTMLYPFWYVVCVALSNYEDILGASLLFWPRNFSLEALSVVVNGKDFLQYISNTIFVVITGTILSMITTIGISYALARKVKGHRIVQYFVFFTLLFYGGMIPTYLVVRSTDLLNTSWALILPRLCDPFNVFLLRNAFRSIPEELDESASIDGAGVLRTLVSIVLPVSLAGIATITLFYSVGYWNSFFDGILYISDRTKWTMQMYLRELLIVSQNDAVADTGGIATATYTVKMATVLVSVIPILVVYPFVQRYFVKGVMVGAVKG